jgi:hypothetical protein
VPILIRFYTPMKDDFLATFAYFEWFVSRLLPRARPMFRGSVGPVIGKVFLAPRLACRGTRRKGALHACRIGRRLFEHVGPIPTVL